MRIGVTAILVLVVAAGLWAAGDVAFAAPAINQAVSVSEAEAVTIPRLISYQGKLLDAAGNPVPDTTYSVSFGLYTVASGGSSFWNEDQTIRTKAGLFSTLLGAVAPIGSVPDVGTLFVGLKVGADPEMAPRLQIASAAYSYLSERAANADALQGKDTTALDSRYVNEGQANSIASGMIPDTNVTMVKIARAGATSGQVIKWSGSAWAPGPDNTGGASDSARVAANSHKLQGKDTTALDGRYVNEGQANSISSGMITDANVTSADIRDTTVNTAELKDASVTAAKLNQMGAGSGQVMKWSGSAWVARNDSAGGPPTGTAGGDLSGTYPNPAIGASAVTSAKILDGTIRGADIALPCTLQGAYSSYTNGILRVRNAGQGTGIWVDTAGEDAIVARRPHLCGLYVDSAGQEGVRVYKSGMSGLRVERARTSGLLVDQAMSYGVSVDSAGAAGVRIIQSGGHGVIVNIARMHGILVGNSGSNGVQIDSAGGDGLRVDTAGIHGVRVYHAEQDAAHLWDAGRDGVRIWQADSNGVHIFHAGQNGIRVEDADSAGVQIDSAGYGVRVRRPFYHGFFVDHPSAGNAFRATSSWASAFLVDSSDYYGVNIPVAVWDGTRIFSKQNGGVFSTLRKAYVGLEVHDSGNVASDTALRAYGRGLASGGWYTGFDDGSEAPGVVSPERTIIACGTARLTDGRTTISYPQLFRRNIRTDVPVRVSLTPRGEPAGVLFAQALQATGFEVVLKTVPGWVEASDGSFDWIAVGTLREAETSKADRARWDQLMLERATGRDFSRR